LQSYACLWPTKRPACHCYCCPYRRRRRARPAPGRGRGRGRARGERRGRPAPPPLRDRCANAGAWRAGSNARTHLCTTAQHRHRANHEQPTNAWSPGLEQWNRGRTSKQSADGKRTQHFEQVRTEHSGTVRTPANQKKQRHDSGPALQPRPGLRSNTNRGRQAVIRISSTMGAALINYKHRTHAHERKHFDLAPDSLR
jgi:hypothetical protein